MLKLQKRPDSPFYYITGTVRPNTEFIRESTGTSSRKDAEIILEKRRKELLDQLGGIIDMSFGEAVRNYGFAKDSIHENDLNRLEMLENFIGKNTPLSQITGQVFNDFCLSEMPKNKNETLNRYRSNLVAVLTHAKKNTPLQHVNKIPTKKTRISKPRYLSFEEQEALLNAYTPLLQPLISTLCFSGCRIGEALRLQWADINLDQRRINIWETKNGDFRSVPMHPRIYEALRGINRERRGHIFVTPSGEPYVYVHRPNGSPIKTGHGNALKKTGITNFKVHNWRSHWASNMALKGSNTYELMALGGWRSSSSVTRYVKLNPDNLAEAINRLD